MIGYIRAILAALSAALFGFLAAIFIPFNYKGIVPHLAAKSFAVSSLWFAGTKVDIIGAEKLNKKEKYIFIANHRSYFDIPILIYSLPNNVRFVYKKIISWVPFFGWGIYFGGYIPIDRNNPRSAIKSLKKAAERMKKGLSVAIFPEGTRTKDGKTGEFKKGAFIIANEAKEKIVPVTIIDSDKILAKGSYKVRPANIKVIISDELEYKTDRNFLNEIRNIIVGNYEKYSE